MTRAIPSFLLVVSWALGALGLSGAARAQSAADAIPFPPELQADVDFWIRVYSQVTTNEGYLHDERSLGVIYETLRFAPNTPPKERGKVIDEARDRYRAILERLAAQPPGESLSSEEQRVRELWGKVDPERLRTAREGVRFQLGQAERFHAGLVRAGAWESHIAQTFANMGLPPEIAALPHVESSFNPAAYSKVGAAGLWQFMRSTGRRYLRIDSAVDERLDPFRSTEAAAQLLAYNYRVLGSWPLALTAYNHGAAGMRRAADSMGTNDYVRIQKHYTSPSFGFASRNFYPSFLAALTIDQAPEKYFGPFERAQETRFFEVVMPAYVHAKTVEKSLGVAHDDLRVMNPALLPTVWNGDRLIPRGYRLRLPATIGVLTAEQLAQRVPDSEQFAGQIESRSYTVKSGDTLEGIAKRQGVTVVQLASLNGLATDAQLKRGRTLRLPERAPRLASGAPAAMAASASGTSSATGAENAGVHVVKRGETLSAIATKYGLKERDLLAANGLRNPNYIFEGQRLQVVTAAASPPPSTPTPQETPSPAVRETREDAAAVAAEAKRASKLEPVTASQAEALGPALVTGDENSAITDPVDYSVAADGSIRVAAAETIGHYADWAGVPASALRQLNGLKAGAPVVLGRKLKLDLSKVTAQQFEQKRRDYHLAVQANYFDAHRILGTEIYVARRGDSLWSISQRYPRVPAWLLQQYNPDADLADLRPGAQVVVPRVEVLPKG